MRVLTLIVLSFISSLATTPTFAAQGGATGYVKVTAEVVAINYMNITSIQDMKMPSVYNNFTGSIHSYDKTTSVIGGSIGQDALFSVNGQALSTYTAVFSEGGVLKDKDGNQLLIGYQIGAGGSVPADNVKTLDANGNDTLAITGSIYLNGQTALVPAGSYNNTTYSDQGPLAVTIAIDRLGAEEE